MLKKYLRIAGISLIGIVTAVLLLAELPICKIDANSFNDHSTFLRDCNKENPNFGNTPITDIAMLGSHDACAYGINFASKPNRNEDNIVNNDFIRVIAKGAIVRYARAQADNIYNQLKAGSRWFDLRVTYLDNTFYTSHGLVSNTLEENIIQFLQFFDENPGEFAILTINEFYKGDATWDDLYSLFENVKYNNKNIFDYTNYESTENDLSSITYNSITKNGSTAGAVIFANDGHGHPFFHQFTSPFYSQWNNEIKTDILLEKMNNRYTQEKYLSKKALRVNQAQTTPTEDDIWNSFWSWSLLSKAKNHNIKVVNQTNMLDIIDTMPISMFDYVSYNGNGFNDKIIEYSKYRNINRL